MDASEVLRKDGVPGLLQLFNLDLAATKQASAIAFARHAKSEDGAIDIASCSQAVPTILESCRSGMDSLETSTRNLAKIKLLETLDFLIKHDKSWGLLMKQSGVPIAECLICGVTDDNHDIASTGVRALRRLQAVLKAARSSDDSASNQPEPGDASSIEQVVFQSAPAALSKALHSHVQDCPDGIDFEDSTFVRNVLAAVVSCLPSESARIALLSDDSMLRLISKITSDHRTQENVYSVACRFWFVLTKRSLSTQEDKVLSAFEAAQVSQALSTLLEDKYEPTVSDAASENSGRGPALQWNTEAASVLQMVSVRNAKSALERGDGAQSLEQCRVLLSSSNPKMQHIALLNISEMLSQASDSSDENAEQNKFGPGNVLSSVTECFFEQLPSILSPTNPNNHSYCILLRAFSKDIQAHGWFLKEGVLDAITIFLQQNALQSVQICHPLMFTLRNLSYNEDCREALLQSSILEAAGHVLQSSSATPMHELAVAILSDFLPSNTDVVIGIIQSTHTMASLICILRESQAIKARERTCHLIANVAASEQGRSVMEQAGMQGALEDAISGKIEDLTQAGKRYCSMALLALQSSQPSSATSEVISTCMSNLLRRF